MFKHMMNINQQGTTKIRTFWGISIILIECTIVIFVFYFLYFFWIENPTPTSNILIVRAISKKSVSIPSEVNADGWLIYSNSDYGLSIKHPSDYKIKQDDIYYGDEQGILINFEKDNNPEFYFRIFESGANENIAEAYQRLTGISPAAYQSFVQEVGGKEAVVYRVIPGEISGDQIFFIANGYFFEAPFNQGTVNMLATLSL